MVKRPEGASSPEPGASGKDPFEELAANVADGVPVDWAGLANSGSVGAAELEALRTLERMRALHEGLAHDAHGERGATEPPVEQGFELLHELGRGAWGTVWRARDRALGREVALKVLNERAVASPAIRERFLHEARLLASLDHPNIVRIHSVDQQEGRLRLSLELLEGQTLEKWAAANGPLSAEEAARVGISLCRALAAIHSRGILHGDVKPANVMRASGGRVVLLDFGVARAAQALQHREPTSTLGTPRFMAPEQFATPPSASPQTDFFAVGVLLYWLVSGRYPVDAQELEELRRQLLAGRIVPLADRRPDVSHEFAAVVHQALALREADRFESAGAMEMALRRCDLADRSGAVASSSSERPRPSRRVVVALAAAAILVGGGAWFLPWGSWLGSGDAFDRLGVKMQWLLVDSEGRPLKSLSEGDRVTIDDRLVLEVTARSDAYVWIFNQDGDGKLCAIFPMAHSDLCNPLRRGTAQQLPGRSGNDVMFWTVTSKPSSEHGRYEDFAIVVAAGSVEAVEELHRTFPKPRMLDDETRSIAYRGIGGAGIASAKSVEPQDVDVGSTRLRDLFSGEGGARSDRLSDYSVRWFRLQNY